jgi:hypothetical protein
VEQVDEKYILFNKATCYEWVWKKVDSHGPIIDSQNIIDVDLRLLYFYRIPSFLAEGPQLEGAIVTVGHGELVTAWALLNFLEFDVVSYELLFERDILRFDVVHFNPVNFVRLFCDR